MKKVLVYGISEKFGGIESFLYSIISNIDFQYVSFDIITYHKTIVYQEAYEKMGVKIYTITSKHSDPVKNRREFCAFFENHGKEYDVVWCNLAELINIDILKLAKKYGIKRRIIHSHSQVSARSPLLTLLHKINRRKIDKIATDFWACSEVAGKWFYNENIINSSQYRVIKNAINTNKFAYNESDRIKIRKKLGINGKFVVGNVGRFSIVEKNTLFLIEIYSEILKLQPNSVLLVVGEGPDRHIIEKKIAELEITDQVMLLGTREDVNIILNAMDVFVLPSNFESLGIVLIEAQTNGLRCFTSAKVVPQEVAITDLVDFIGLDQAPSEWAEAIVNKMDYNRKSRIEAVKVAGYEVSEETEKIRKIIEEE